MLNLSTELKLSTLHTMKVLFRNKALQLVKTRHMTCKTQLECIITEQCSYAKFVQDSSSRFVYKPGNQTPVKFVTAMKLITYEGPKKSYAKPHKN